MRVVDGLEAAGEVLTPLVRSVILALEATALRVESLEREVAEFRARLAFSAKKNQPPILTRSRPMRLRTALLLALVAPAMIACESIVSDDAPVLPATFVLEAPVTRESSDARFTLLADTLRLSNDGSALRSTRSVFTIANRTDTTFRADARYLFELDGGGIELTYICGPAELCGPAPHYTGRFEDGRMIIRPVNSNDSALRYTRIN